MRGEGIEGEDRRRGWKERIEGEDRRGTRDDEPTIMHFLVDGEESGCGLRFYVLLKMALLL